MSDTPERPTSAGSGGGSSPGESPVVLHVDDDETIRGLVDRFLGEHGMTVVSESSPAVAAERLRGAADVDCVVSDYDMPGSDGLEFLETVRELCPRLPFVLFTGKGSEEIASEAIGAGVTDYVQKSGGAETYEMLAKRIDNAVARYRAEQARRRSERRFDSLFETVPDAVLDVDTEGTIRAANPATERVLGRAPDSLVGEQVVDLLPPEHRATYAERFAAYVESGERALAWTDTVIDVAVDGERRPVSVSLGERTVDGERRVTAVIRDVSEREGRRERLREAKQRFRRLIEADVVGIYTVRDRTFEYVNPRMADLLGYEPTALIGEPVMTVVPERERERVAEKLRLRETGETESVNYTLQLERADGDLVTVHGEGTRVEEEDGEPVIVGAVRDVTERERARQELQARRDRIAALHDAAVEVAAATTETEVAERTVDAAREVLDMDRSLVAVADGDGLPAVAVSDVVGDEEYYGSVPVDDPNRLSAETYRTGESRLVEDLQAAGYETADEAYRSAICVPLGDRGVFQTVAVEPGAFDEGDLRTAELLAAHAESALERLESRERLRERTRRLEEQNERLETFASVVSHDLRNPIEVARANLALAEHGDEDALPKAGAALDRMEAIVDDVLQLARGPGSVDTLPVALGPVVEEAWDTVHSEDATLSVDLEGVTVAADRGQLRRLLENLLSNAVEHSSTGSQTASDDVAERSSAGSQPEAGNADPAGEEGTTTIRVGVVGTETAADGGEAALDEESEASIGGFYVADDGAGVAPEQQGAVFEPGVTEEEDGTGLGLAIVEGIAAAHDWSVRLTDSAAGGVRVEVTGVETP